MKVGIFTDSFLPAMNGVVRSTCLLIDQLVKNGIEVEVFAPGVKNKVENYHGATIRYFKGKKLFFYPKYFFTMPFPIISDYSKKLKDVDIFHVQDPFMMGIAGLRIAKKNKKPVVGTYHTFFEEYVPHLTKGKLKFLVKDILKWPTRLFVNNVYDLCNITIAPTKEIKDYLKTYGVDKVEIIPTGIDLDFFRKARRKDIRKKYKIPKKSFIFIYAGRISFEKKLEILLHAFKMIQEEKKNVYLLIVGDGPHLKGYKHMTKVFKIKNVIFTNHVSDKELISCYCNSDVFVSPSDTETQGLTFLEAMACDLPVIGARKRGTRSMVSRSSGLLFKPMDIRDLYKKMKLLLNNKKKLKKLKKGVKRVVEKFSAEKFGKKHIKLYRKLIRRVKS
jgi:1,2-diacylglycerol 3-alpha-glucosyltransferase